jgi:hypothetical protein
MKLGWKNFAKNVGIGVTLLSLTITLKGANQFLSYLLIAIIGLESLVVLFENISTNRIWKRVVGAAGGFDFTYVGLGLGLFKLGIAYANKGWEWIGIIALLASAILMGMGIGENFGENYSTIVKKDWKYGVIMGAVFIIIGLVQIIVSWKSIMSDAIVNAPFPSTFIILGGMWVCYGIIRAKKINYKEPNAEKES